MNFFNIFIDDDAVEQAVAIYTQGHEDTLLWGGSRPGRAPSMERLRSVYDQLLFNDYWGPSPVYNAHYFKKHFKLPIELFDEIHELVKSNDEYFQQKPDAAGLMGISSLTKIACAVRQLTSGVSPNELDDKYRMAPSTGLETLKRFCSSIIAIYGDSVLRFPNEADLNNLLAGGLSSGFPGCIGSIDCMHWEWKNCPSGWKGMFQGKDKVPTVVLEAIADHQCRFWHFNFGSPGTLNDINILGRSPLFQKAVSGESPQIKFAVNGHDYNYAYWLTDGIYPDYACFVKTVSNPATRMQTHFASAQEAKRKDIERAFGILQARFHVLVTGCRLWSRESMAEVIETCVILHNLIIDRGQQNERDYEFGHYLIQHPFAMVRKHPRQSIGDRERMIQDMQDSNVHTQLQTDLMTSMWENYALSLE
ncbi:hypothetical protein Ae201684P_000701 [Aphanomyces euteiches]|uniref:DDE Tnp4 domain-containing protein n=1 Tax=Aphanomyces euteiches TaxID=100861 RepID=A0A6G0XA31_9STRA|nr:hypothetical protein Ae201684_006787 [Aphanomyces euteiches]KAH9087290.1 hypothetical protein Ae201684P_000701 [Aphanomyces euteiches]